MQPSPTPDELAREYAQTRLGNFASLVSGFKASAKHHQFICEKLEQVERGEIKRLLVTCPPGAAKSHYANVMFSAWFLGRNPRKSILTCSANADLSANWGRKVRNLVGTEEYQFVFPGVAVSSDNRAADQWSLVQGGEDKASGVGAAIVGRRADLGVIDDPIASREDADSEATRQRLWDWWLTDFRTRLKPGAGVVLIQTRWHESDLAGKLLDDAKRGGEQWEVINIPAIAEANDVLGRAEGEPLWPEWFTPEQFAQAKRDTRTWTSLYQQRPTATEGSIIKRAYWEVWTEPVFPEPLETIASIDTAYTAKEENDASACTIWNVYADEMGDTKLVLRYAWREKFEFNELVSHISETCDTFGVDRMLIEAKASGLSVIQELRRRWPRLVIEGINPSKEGDKVARAHACTSVMESGRVYVPAKIKGGEPEIDANDEYILRPFAQLVVDECASFPLGRYKDITDTVTQFLNWVRRRGYEFFEEDSPAPPRMKSKVALY